MRRVHRVDLPGRAQAYLDRHQAEVADAQAVERAWKAARQTQTMKGVFGTLQSMMGPRERCMYCVDSHGSDIDHFRPKVTYPDHAFRWSNMLLCCTECGRFKGNRFPLSGAGQPLLVDPSANDPWDYLDFDPDTGNLTARYDVTSNMPSPEGECTVQVLQLDRREALAEGYRRTYQRIVACVNAALMHDAVDPAELVENLRHVDDHGLLGWCFGAVGSRLQPFSELLRDEPEAWNACLVIE